MKFYHTEMMYYRIKRTLALTILGICVSIQFGACRKFVEIPPPSTELVTTAVFSSDATATSAVLGIYSSMMQNHGFASINTGLYAGLSADELTDYSNDAGQREFFTNSINPSNTSNTNLWSNAYQYIYTANAVLEGLASSTSVSMPVKSQLQAEAKFIRAFCYFYLTNLFGDVPLIASTAYAENAKASRNTREAVYGQIINDLKESAANLSSDYKDPNNNSTTERTRPNQSAAMALLSRVYLYQKDWADAEALSSNVINQSGLYSLETLNNIFLKNSNESIWQLQPVNPSFDTYEGNVFILTSTPSGSFGTALSSSLLSAFEPNDMRRLSWVDSIISSGQTYYYAFKYKVATADPAIPEYSMVLRLSEQFLIRAESRAEQNNLIGAVQDLNIVRTRAGLANTTAADISSFRAAVLHERQTELFTEWGHRWFDLKRTGNLSTALLAVKPEFTDYDSLYPIPVTEIKNDPNISQNPGY